MTKYAILDFETTGLSPIDEKLTQAAIIKISLKEDQTLDKVEYFDTLINPEKEISAKITELTGISNETVKDAPTEKEAIKDIIDFISDAIIIAQNAPFDLGFLRHATIRAGIEPKVYDFICTRTKSAILFTVISHKLVDMTRLFDIKLEEAHNAIYDAKATMYLFLKLASIASIFGIDFLNKLVYHPDRKNVFEPENKIIIPLQKR